VTTVADDLVRDYVKRLERELSDVPRARRREILDEIREHIEAAGPTSEVDVRNVLDRLGDPGEIADEARSRFGVKPARGGPLEVAALVLLLIGGFLAGVGWLVGVALLWGSAVWTTREKLLGTLIVPGGLLMPVVLAFSSIGSQGCIGNLDERTGAMITRCTPGPSTASQLLLGGVLLVALIGPVAVSVYLARQMRRRST
jgi:HAAS